MDLTRVRKGIANPGLAIRHVFRTLRWSLLERYPKAFRLEDGVHVLEEDWDNLIILDACRFDVFSEVNDLDGALSHRISRGGATREFIRENFDGRSARDTIYVSANAMVGACRDYLDVYRLVGLWGGQERSQAESDTQVDSKSVPDPEPVVETARRLAAEHPDKRLIVHFLPPHVPFLVKDGASIPPDSPYRTYDGVLRGDVSTEEIRAVYRENVEYVLDHVGTLLEALDGKTVVTADHGELLGEGAPWPMRVLHPRWPLSKLGNFDFGHYSGFRLEELVKVPWFVVEGNDRKEIREEPTIHQEYDDEIIEEQLAALGYK